jgi:uncharacterized protein
VSTARLEALLEVQSHDTAIDRLRRRYATLEARAAHEGALAAVDEIAVRHASVIERRDEVAHLIQRLDDDAASIKAHAAGVEAKLYSGAVASPRELQALQADLAQLQRQQRGIEDRELEGMELREGVEAELTILDKELAEAREEAERLGRVLAEEEAAIDAEMKVETRAREDLVAGIPSELRDLYERCRERGNGVGAARLEGNMCRGCRLTIPATAVDRIKKADADAVAHCDNCGAILVL